MNARLNELDPGHFYYGEGKESRAALRLYDLFGFLIGLVNVVVNGR